MVISVPKQGREEQWVQGYTIDKNWNIYKWALGLEQVFFSGF